MKLKITFLLLSLFAAFFQAACDNGSGQTGDGGASGNVDSSNSNGGGSVCNTGSCAALPSNINAQTIASMYNSWISTFYVTYENDASITNPQLTPDGAAGTARIRSVYSGTPSDGSYTASEAIGYGMILTSLMEDWDKFDKLWAYSKIWYYKINGEQTALMRWSVWNFTVAEGGSATDADIDIMASLFIAYRKTHEQRYLDGALEIGKSIYKYEIDANTRLVLPATNIGETMGNGTLYNISYMSLPALKMLEMYDTGGERNWSEVLDKNISYMKSVQDNGDGLWPDWSDASGVPKDPNNGSSSDLCAQYEGWTCISKLKSHEAYYKESVRIPWRVAWYYHWFGDERAKQMLNKGIAFLRSRGAQNLGLSDVGGLKNFYAYTGNRQGTVDATDRDWPSLCALGMGDAANQDWLNSCNAKILNSYTPQVSQYYPSSLQLIYSMLFNGKFQ